MIQKSDTFEMIEIQHTFIEKVTLLYMIGPVKAGNMGT